MKSPEFHIIDEAEDYLVVDKPPFLLIHPTKPDGPPTLWKAVRELLAFEIANGGQVSIVNRLDRETSGIVLIAKTAPAARRFGLLMQGKKLAKEYLALVWGWPEWETQVVDAPLDRKGKHGPSAIWLKQAIIAKGAAAVTEFEVLERFAKATSAGDRFALIRARPLTGRTHQIRVHLASIGHPIVGDKIYGPDEKLYLEFIQTGWTRSLEERLLMPRHALHASRLSIEGDKDWEAPLPHDIEEFLRDDQHFPLRVAHSSRVLVAASRRNNLQIQVGDEEDGITSTRDECATRNSAARALFLGSAGCQPAVLSNLAENTLRRSFCSNVCSACCRQAAGNYRLAACAPLLHAHCKHSAQPYRVRLVNRLCVAIAFLAVPCSLVAGVSTPVMPPNDVLDPPRFEVAFESAYLMSIANSPHDYEIAAEFLTARIRWGVNDNPGWMRGYQQFCFTTEAQGFIRGVENRYFGINFGMRYNFVQPNSRWIPFISGGLGLGWIDSNAAVGGSQGQDFTFNILSAAGLSYQISERWKVDAAFVWEHFSNGGQTDPNPSLNLLGPQLAVRYSF